MVGQRIGLFIILMILIIPFSFAADLTPEQIQEALLKIQQGGAGPTTYQFTQADFEKYKQDIITAVNEENNQNWPVLEGRIQDFFNAFSKKIVIGVLGLNALVAGAVFYYINKTNRRLSYQSVALRRRRDEDERVQIVGELNNIRDKLGGIEDYNKKLYETYVLPLQDLRRYVDEQREREQQQRASFGGGDGSGGYYAQPGNDGGYSQPQNPSPVEGEYYSQEYYAQQGGYPQGPDAQGGGYYNEPYV